MNIIDRFSTHLREALTKSIRLATELKDQSVEPMHLLLALSMQKGSVASEVLNRHRLDAKNIEKTLINFQPGITETNLTVNPACRQAGLSPFSTNSKIALEKALVIAQKNGHNYLGTEHLLSALLHTNDSWLEQLFKKNNLKKTELDDHLEIVLANGGQFPQITEVPEVINRLQESLSDDALLQTVLPENKKNKSPYGGSGKKETALDFFAANLTSPEIQSGIDPVIGRAAEIERMMQILCRRAKNNPILLGDPGVGKTAIVEGLAKKIAEGEVPDILLNKKIYALDMGMLIAGTAYRGEFEGRLRQVIEEASNDPEVVLFIDELHNIVGAGSNQGAMDAANILKPALARGQIRCIGATTPAEFKKYIEGDAALERRFQPIQIKESSVADTIKIMIGIKKNYEDFHNLRITDKAIAKAAHLADRYITNKLLPDKAIDLLDETAAAKRLRIKPTALESKLWGLKQELEQTIMAKEEAAAGDNFGEAVKLKAKEKILEKEINDLKKYSAKGGQAGQKTNGPLAVITEKDIVDQLAKIIDAPVRDLFINEKRRASKDGARHDSAESNNLVDFESILQKNIIGQDEVLREVSERVRQAQLELSSPNRPLASFLFVGESGVGKTELAKSLARALYPHQSSLIQLNMSEFNESFAVSKLLGSPAGYIGYKENNQFTDRIKINPYCVILLDEIDKAHKDVTKLLLQILENGEITDSVGKKISLKRAVIILTTSLGADELKKSHIGFGKRLATADAGCHLAAAENKKRIKEKLKDFFSPELINRLDQICLFNNLTQTDLAKIAALEIADLNKQLEPYHTSLKADEKIFAWFVNQLAEKNNAREVRRQIRNSVEKIMAELITQNRIKISHKLVLQKDKLAVK